MHVLGIAHMHKHNLQCTPARMQKHKHKLVCVKRKTNEHIGTLLSDDQLNLVLLKELLVKLQITCSRIEEPWNGAIQQLRTCPHQRKIPTTFQHMLQNHMESVQSP